MSGNAVREKPVPENSEEKANKQSSVAFMVRALRNPNYRLFFIGQIISLMGTWITQIATTWLVYRLTNSAWMLGAVGFAGQIPAFLLGPIAGVWVDRLNRHKLLVVTQALAMVQSFLLAGLALTDTIDINHILALLAFQGLINAFDMPARQAFVIELIENKADLSNAIALNASMFNLARLVGPPVGGLMIAAVGEGWCFTIDGISYLAVIACLVAMKVPARPRTGTRGNPMEELKEGYRYAFGSPAIRAILFLMGSISLIGMPYGVIMPVVAKETLHGDAHTLGLLMAATGMGALAAALTMAARKSILGLSKVIPCCTIGFGLALLAFSQTRIMWLALPFLFLAGYAMMLQNASCNTLLQTIVTPDKRGRVMSLYTMAFMGMAPLGSLWAGALANSFGAPFTLAVSGVGSLLAGGWFLTQVKALRRDVRPIYEQLGILPPVAAALDNTAELATPPERIG